MNRAVIKYSVRLANHRTSVSVEPVFWQALHDIAEQQQLTARQLIERIDDQRLQTASPLANLSSALRVYVLLFYRQKAEERDK